MKKSIIGFLFLCFLAVNVFAGEGESLLIVPEDLEPDNESVTVFYDQIPVESSEDGQKIPEIKTIPDPFEPVNRVTFFFNDKIYRYGISPVGHVYEVLIPRVIRDRFHNIFQNLAFPKYFLSALFQGKIDKSFKEVGRFVINSTAGIGGMFDVAGNMGIKTDPEDFGQTLATYGIDHGFYFVLPILGPSSGRDTFGLLFDSATDGKTYIQFAGSEYNQAAIFIRFNSTVMTVREYERVTDQQFDPYRIVRDLYYAYREAEVLK